MYRHLYTYYVHISCTHATVQEICEWDHYLNRWSCYLSITNYHYSRYSRWALLWFIFYSIPVLIYYYRYTITISIYKFIHYALMVSFKIKNVHACTYLISLYDFLITLVIINIICCSKYQTNPFIDRFKRL